MVSASAIEETVYRIERVAFGGYGLCRYNDFVLMVKGGIPGDYARLRVVKKKKNYAEAIIEELLEPSPYRLPAPCKHFGICGGCVWQHVDYPAQLRFKQAMIEDVFRQIGGLSLKVPLPRHAEHIFHYRNKMEFTFNDRAWLTAEQIANPLFRAPDCVLGLHIPQRFDKVLPIEYCYLQSDTANRCLRVVSDFAAASELPPYSATAQTGFWRFLVIRESHYTHERLVHVITYDPQPKVLEQLKDELLQQVPGITSFIHSINSRKSQVAVGERSVCLYGKSGLTEHLLGKSFFISPLSFFQTHTRAAELLYQTIIELARFQGDEKVYDLYCGTGSIALCIAPYVRSVTGIEQLPEAIDNARYNAELNGVPNAQFMTGDILQTLRQLRFHANMVILDPPRSGLHPDVIPLLLRAAPETILYVSCHPATQVRDIRLMLDHYEIDGIQPVDMFPHTYHIENVIRLKRR